VNVVWAILITLAAAALAITAMLLVRRHAPGGSFFRDGDRASGVFGVIATGFSVLLGFIVFLAFTNYDQSRSGAETEATVLVQQAETAQLLPKPEASALTGMLVCYGRSVVHQEWPRMRDGTIGNAVNPWGIAMIQVIRSYEPESNRQQAAYGQWLSQTSDREQGRLDRVHGAAGVMPTTLWIVLFFISAIVFSYMLFFADPDEGPVTQAMLMGGVVSVMTVLLLLLVSLDRPYHGGVGGLHPTAMERSLELLDQGLSALGVNVTPPCDASGNRTGA
jgi:hypothetical protein